MDTDKLYANAPLNLAGQHIRLVQIQPGAESEVIQCKFHCFPLPDCPAYVALSYAWGPPKIYKQILVENSRFPLQRNLWWFLYYARIRNEDQLFWIDAMCINQSSNAERNHQVRLMGQIYSTAMSVAVWLGEAEKLAESDLAMDFVEQKGLAPLRTKAGRFLSIWNQEQGKAFYYLCERSYWTRIWVVQEIMHAKELTVFCGGKSFPWRHIDQIFQKLRKIEDRGHIVHHQRAVTVLGSPASILIEAKSVWLGVRRPLLSLLATYRNQKSTDIRDKVIGLLSLASDSGPILVDYSLSAESFFWRVLECFWASECLGDRTEMIRVAEILKDTLKVYVLEEDLDSRIYKAAGLKPPRYSTYSDYARLSNEPQQYRMASTSMANDDMEVEETQPMFKGPLVEEKKSSEGITAEYALVNTVYIEQTSVLPQKYSHYRTIRGDGNNGWRAVAFGYFETLLKLGNKSQFEEEIQRMDSLCQMLTNVGGFATSVYEDMVKETKSLLGDLADTLQSPPLDSAQLLQNRFNDSSISNSIIYHLKLLASSHLKSRLATYLSFIPEGLGIERYRKTFIEPINEQVDPLTLIILTHILLKPIGFAVQIEYLDRSEGPRATNTFVSREEDENGLPTNPGGPMIHLLYRPNHYDILYKNQNSFPSPPLFPDLSFPISTT